MRLLFFLFLLNIESQVVAQDFEQILSEHFSKQKKDFWVGVRTLESAGSLLWNNASEERMELKLKKPSLVKLSSKSLTQTITPTGNKQKVGDKKATSLDLYDSLFLSSVWSIESPLFYEDKCQLDFKGQVSLDGKLCYWLINSIKKTEYFIEVATSLFYKTIITVNSTFSISFTVLRYEKSNEIYLPRIIMMKSQEKSLQLNLEKTTLGNGIPNTEFGIE